jgi:hypothetical protein
VDELSEDQPAQSVPQQGFIAPEHPGAGSREENGENGGKMGGKMGTDGILFVSALDFAGSTMAKSVQTGWPE